MNKYITALITFNKTESLFLIKPLHFTFCQNRTLLSQLFAASGHHSAENKKTTPALDSIYQPAVVIPLGLQNMNTQLFPITPPLKIHCACYLLAIPGTQLGSGVINNIPFLANQAFLKNIFTQLLGESLGSVLAIVVHYSLTAS
jgi:hypothetical protein